MSKEAYHDKVTEEPRPRRSFVKPFVFLVVIATIAGALLHPKSPCYRPLSLKSRRSASKSIEKRVEDILSKTPLIDGHNDFAYFIRMKYNNHIYYENFTEPFVDGGLELHTDLPRLREGQNGGAFWSVYVPCPANGSDWSDEKCYSQGVQATLQQIDVMERLQAAYPGEFSGSLDSKSARAAFKDGKLVSPLGVEGLHQIGNSVANLRRFHAAGARYVTLTHNCGNIYADSALLEDPLRKAPPYWKGVSPQGRKLVNEMNRIGLIVDLAHTSADTMTDILGGSEEEDGWAGSKAPVMFSHSSAYALCPHPRNVPDHVLELVKKRDSIVMVNFAPDFVSCVDNGNSTNGIPDFYPANNTLSHVADHITYIGDKIGYEYVGLGSDFDGIGSTPEGLEDVSKYPDLIAELLRRGVSDHDASRIVGGNILRVWEAVEKVAAKLQANGEPVLEDDLPSLI